MSHFEFAAPARLWFLLVVVAFIAAYLVLTFRRRHVGLRFSNVDLLDRLKIGGGAWRRHLVSVLAIGALTVSVLAMAQPQTVVHVPKERATIMLALDTSISMEATDVTPTRFEAAKAAAKKFVASIPAKVQLGVVSFNKTAKINVTPTADRAAATRAIDGLTLHEGTAIGEAVAASLESIAEIPPDADGKKAPAAIVLLTDGSSTAGRDPAEVAPEAKAAGVPVYTIAFGTQNGKILYDSDGDGRTEEYRVAVDPQPLVELSKATGGTSFEATTAEDLSAVYQSLGSAVGYDEELSEITWWFAGAAVALLALSSLLSMWWFQRMI